MGNKFLLTGGTGFIGSVLVRTLVEAGEEVHVIIRKEAKRWRIQDLESKVTLHFADLTDTDQLPALLKQIQPTVIYHLAAHGAYAYQRNAAEIMRTNILGTLNLLQAANTIDYDLFVNTGTSSEYGFKQVPIKESDVLEPMSYYAVAKCAQTHLCTFTAKAERRPIVTLRPFSVYGPFEEPTRLIPTLIKSLYTHTPMNLVNPDTAHDHIYVGDLVAAYLKIDRLKHYPGEAFNLGSGVQSSVKTVVDTAVSTLHRTTDFHWNAMPARSWDTTQWVADITKARQLLQWQPETSLTEGLLKTWEWYQSHQALYV